MNGSRVAKVLVAGIGNIFHADDGFGVEVVRLLEVEGLPETVQIVDFGIRGLDFAYALLDDSYESVILVDALSRQKEPGTLFVIEPQFKDGTTISSLEGEVSPGSLKPASAFGGDSEQDTLSVEPHGMNPEKVLGWARSMGRSFKYVRIVGCEPQSLGSEVGDVEVGLSPAVAAALPRAVELTKTLITEAL